VLPCLRASRHSLVHWSLQSAAAPDDYQQGATVNHVIHVPNAAVRCCWAVMSAASLGTLVWRHPPPTSRQGAARSRRFTFLAW